MQYSEGCFELVLANEFIYKLHNITPPVLADRQPFENLMEDYQPRSLYRRFYTTLSCFYTLPTEYNEIHSKTSVIEEKSQALHKQIVELSDNKMKAAQDRVNKAAKELESNKAKINKLNVNIKSNSRSVFCALCRHEIKLINVG